MGKSNHGSPNLTSYWGEIEQNSENLKKASWTQNIVIITPLIGLFELNQRVIIRVSKINGPEMVPLEDSSRYFWPKKVKLELDFGIWLHLTPIISQFIMGRVFWVSDFKNEFDPTMGPKWSH